MPNTDRRALYSTRAERFEREQERLEARSQLISNLRGLSFGIGVISLLVAGFARGGTAATAIAVLGLIAFLALVILHARVIEAGSLATRFAEVNRAALARVTHHWHELPDQGNEFNVAGRPFADDLDVFGRGSLYQRLCTARTRYGRQRLAELLVESAEALDLEGVLGRQAAVRALSPRLEERQELEALAMAVTRSKGRAPGGSAPSAEARREPDPEPLLRWAEQPLGLLSQRLRWAARLLPAATAAGALGANLAEWPHLTWAAPLFVQAGLALWAHPRTTEIFGAVSTTEGAFLTYGGMLALLERLETDAERLLELKTKITTRGVPASVAMREFRARVAWFDLRHNGMVHPFLAVLLLWDIHCGLSLEEWKARYGRHLRSWFEALGELEALSALGSFAHDEPNFTYPTLVTASASFELTGLGHPLIAHQERIVNDVALSGPGSALLVTGSNMSGKSTLLRAMGLTAVLAAAGAPVCAKRAHMSLFVLRTSIRVRDSLEGGISHFYAELNKLKSVVVAAENAVSTRPVLFLLDEILHGTNSTERQIGARWVLGRLLELGAMGAVSTHDLELCRLPDPLMARVRLVHFSEQINGDRMSFDYRMRAGPVTAGNALRLMREVGLDVPVLGSS